MNNEELKNQGLEQLVHRLKWEYILFWALALVLMVIYELGWMEEGTLAHDGQKCYLLQTLGVLLALGLIPFSLKMFSLAVIRRLPELDAEQALKVYRRWSEVRLAMLMVVTVVNLSVYYVTLSSIGGLCALLGGLASLFCWPDVQRMKSELGWEEK